MRLLDPLRKVNYPGSFTLLQHNSVVQGLDLIQNKSTSFFKFSGGGGDANLIKWPQILIKSVTRNRITILALTSGQAAREHAW